MGASNIKDKDIQLTIGALLRYGIWTSLFVSITGGVLYLIKHYPEVVHYDNFKGEDTNLFQLLSATLQGAGKGNARDIIMTGILLLFLTPVLRIIFSLVAFFLEKDYLYTAITLIVIIIIALSISFGFAH